MAGKHEIFSEVAVPEVEVCNDGKVNICGRVSCIDRSTSEMGFLKTAASETAASETAASETAASETASETAPSETG
eukprot:639550-Pleurochrysis_carterae.AAC.1